MPEPDCLLPDCLVRVRDSDSHLAFSYQQTLTVRIPRQEVARVHDVYIVAIPAPDMLHIITRKTLDTPFFSLWDGTTSP